MKNILFLLTSLLIFSSCEEIVEVDLDTAPVRLVIDASINWDQGSNGSIQTIKLSTTTGYFQDVIPKVSGANVYITNSSNITFNFIEASNTGNYICTNFVPVINEDYTLTVIYDGQTYKASEKLMPTPEILDIEQTNDIGINNDEVGIKINFLDFSHQRNYYLFRFDSAINPFPEYQVVDDQFSDGNIMSWLYSHEKLTQGKKINFTQYGVSENYYNYMILIINASTGSSGGPFQVTPTKARGNIINQTSPQNYALGYFRLCETKRGEYTIQ